ncbi:MAG: iron-sulfur cluster repair di-iron protein [Bacteroidales bacterium]|nr:iron-sulfur cluster repair di-iron protein [Bacteroidales bacterium]MCF8343954.1 iron-sulfur cluster repair di-iron protein [Bacteroidales bacterium]MCF8351194.1 iron-sulfur cluster repair di-iron protein [Bacteroidales bacterium]MCF8375323.1 iron-sulfur cluster repair di-iron protein [Bacteroidales bacterium]MCF8400179.1 iron-sulfur cluster repair di-iron protein [Bacteroidales bacterium]
MNLTTDKVKFESVSKFVTENYKTAEVFKKYGIDFCCGGRKTLDQACDEAGVDIAVLKEELENVNIDETDERDFNTMNPDDLIDYIISIHHRFVAENIPLLLEYTKKIAEVHYDTNPELKEIRDVFLGVAQELQQHMMKEEQILFPFIKNLYNPEKYLSNGSCGGAFGTVQNPIAMMEHEHESAGKAFRNIRELSDNYDFPPHACNTYIVTFKKLEEFEDDLHKHIHLENNILFPKAIRMETEKSQ